ncbi:MAG: SEL1-like repeat protein [Clostridia bacterium]|nr:SEL1-like repeat protein [Clostridia bacterium]
MSTLFDEGYAYEKGGDFLRAIEFYEIAAKEGDDRADCRLGSIYRFGRGVPKDYERALYYYHRSADKGNSYAQSNIGSMYRFGQGVKKDYDIAFSWYTRSAEQDNEYAQQNLGSMYRFGEGRDKDTDLAFFWYSKAAAQGNMFSEANLGSMYRLGDGVKRDYEKAFYWYSRAAAQGYAYAKYELGILYYHGFSVEKDYKTAFSLLKEYENDTFLDFAKNGEAFYYLGECYKHGLGTEKDLLVAKSYYEKALEAGFNCRLTLDMLRRDLGERGAMGITREYAANLLSENISTHDLLKKIERDLREDFGYHWDMLKQNARQALVSGMFYYVITVGYGEEVYRSLDFTNVVALLSKALETELMEFFGRCYVEYLKDIRKIPASSFDPDTHRFVRYSPAWKKEKENIVYADEMGFFGFSLGALYHLIGVENLSAFGQHDPENRAYRKKIKGRDKTINPLMRDYAKMLFRTDAFGEGDFNESVVNYLIDFAEDIKCIKDIRNPADHGVIVDRSHAEFCSDVIIKVYKIFIDFLDKLSPEYVEKSLAAPQRTLDSIAT